MLPTFAFDPAGSAIADAAHDRSAKGYQPSANTREVADLIGDESERTGAHNTRHVEAEQNIIRAFNRIKDSADKA